VDLVDVVDGVDMVMVPPNPWDDGHLLCFFALAVMRGRLANYELQLVLDALVEDTRLPVDYQEKLMHTLRNRVRPFLKLQEKQPTTARNYYGQPCVDAHSLCGWMENVVGSGTALVHVEWSKKREEQDDDKLAQARGPVEVHHLLFHSIPLDALPRYRKIRSLILRDVEEERDARERRTIEDERKRDSKKKTSKRAQAEPG
jgi:hypothetical protein